MAVKVMMSKGSDTMTEGKVLKWLKQEGDAVSTGEAVVEIETDKVDMEVEALGGGVLRKILVGAGKVVPVGELLALIGKPDEDLTSLMPGDGKPAPAPAAAGTLAEKGTATPPATSPMPVPAVGGTLATVPPPEAGGRVLASPLARRMATEMGLELANIAGTGPSGRIIRQDVERSAALASQARVAHPAASVPSTVRAPAPLPPRPAPSLTGPEFFDEPLSAMRKTIATRLVQSKAPVPHFYLTIEVDMKRAKELRESANLLDPELKLSYNDIILKACASTLRRHPQVNASFQGESIRFHNRVHLGMAVATEGGGLITPVIRNADAKSLQEISREAKDLAARARTRKLAPEEFAGSTFSVSNLGMMGIEEFSAVINPPEGAILAVGAVAEKPIVREGRVEVGLRCRMTLSCDHRVVDGATGAKFLETLKQTLENPVYLAF